MNNMQFRLDYLLSRFSIGIWFIRYHRFINSLGYNPHALGHRHIEWLHDYIAGIPSCQPQNLYGAKYD